MTVPNVPEKLDADGILRPQEHLSQFGLEAAAVPPAIVLTFQEPVRAVASEQAVRTVDLPNDELYVLEHEGMEIGFYGDFGIGAPITGAVADSLATLGVETMLILGGCGAVQPDVDGNTAFVISAAIRDEGTSHHYLDPARTVSATDGVVDALEGAVSAAEIPYEVGPTWTTDGIYRETLPELQQYRSEGVLGVEMEVAALFAVARYHDRDCGALLAPFDALRTDGWVAQLEAEDRLERLVPVVLDALARRREATG